MSYRCYNNMYNPYGGRPGMGFQPNMYGPGMMGGYNNMCQPGFYPGPSYGFHHSPSHHGGGHHSGHHGGHHRW
jgi:hypothetical protein